MLLTEDILLVSDFELQSFVIHCTSTHYSILKRVVANPTVNTKVCYSVPGLLVTILHIYIKVGVMIGYTVLWYDGMQMCYTIATQKNFVSYFGRQNKIVWVYIVLPILTCTHVITLLYRLPILIIKE